MLHAILYQKKGERREEAGMEERRDRLARCLGCGVNASALQSD